VQLQSVLGGAAPGSIQLLVAGQSSPIAAARLAFAGGQTSQSNASGSARVPAREPTTVLQQLTIGKQVVLAQLVVDSLHGYALQIDVAGGTIDRVLVNVVELVLPPLLQGGLLVLLVCVIGYRLSRRHARRRTSAVVTAFPPRAMRQPERSVFAGQRRAR
jgi:hypothetical protein